jgi:hypothetical protein
MGRASQQGQPAEHAERRRSSSVWQSMPMGHLFLFVDERHVVHERVAEVARLGVHGSLLMT